MIPSGHVAGLCLHLRYIAVLSLIVLFTPEQSSAQDLWKALQHSSGQKAVRIPSRIAQRAEIQRSLERTFIFSPIDVQAGQKQRKSFDQPLLLKVDNQSLDEVYQGSAHHLRIHIPIDDSSGFDLLVYKTALLAPDYRLILKGSSQDPSIDNITRFYHGIIDGLTNSIVTLSLMKGQLIINMHFGKENFRLSKRQKDSTTYELRSEVHLQKSSSPICSTSDERYHQKINDPAQINPGKHQKSGNCVGIYLETDKFTYDAFNQDVGAVQNYFLNLMNEVAALYANEDVSIQLTQLVVPTTVVEDWSAPETSMNSLLERFGEQLQDNYTGRLAHFATIKNFGGGLGWIDVLCNSYSTFWADWDGDGENELHHYGPFAVSTGLSGDIQPVPTYTYDVAVVTHEIGHNLGSFHTHACAWGPSNQAIDNCSSTEGTCSLINDPPLDQDLGTIMSYCHTTSEGIDFTKGFGSLPGNLIRNKINNAVCFLDCDDNYLYGCTDPAYHNYNPQASIDDASCSGTCTDNIKNGDETGVDCGGSLCAPCGETCNQNSIRITLRFDNHPEETSWQIVDSITDEVIQSGGTYLGYPDGSTEIIDLCLSDGTYTFTIIDNWGDGMCCSSGDGFYLVTGSSLDTLAFGGQFTNAESTDFTLTSNQCENVLVVSGDDVDGIFESSEMIMTSGMTHLVSETIFNSPDIAIYEDFKIPAGLSFEIFNEGCNN